MSWPLYPWKRDPLPIAQRAGWAPGSGWTGLDPQDRPARGESLYRLSYPGPPDDLSQEYKFILLILPVRWAGQVVRMGEEKGVYRVLVGKPEGKRPLGRPRRRWVDNIRMNLQEVGCELDWAGPG